MRFPRSWPVFKTFLATLFIALSVSLSQAGNKEFQSLFNGRTLEGWKGKPGAWTVQNGAIRCTGDSEQKNWLIWKGGELKDFELRLQFRYHKGNSGVQVRSKELDNWRVRGYQVEVAPQNKMGLWHHSLSPAPYRGHLSTAGLKTRITPEGEKKAERFAPAEKVQSAFKPGEWNRLTVVARGSELIQKINGTVFSILIDEDEKYARRSGVLALQDHGRGTVVEFKDIRLKDLSDSGGGP